MKLRKRPVNENPVHIIAKEINGRYLIERTKEPFIQVIYNPKNKEGVLFSDIHQTPEINAALKKAIAWARANIIN